MTLPIAGRLLVLDDQAEVASTICSIARRIGFEACYATGVEAFLTLHDMWRPSHVVLDLILTDSDGIEVVRALAERGSDAGILITSGAGTRVLEAAERASAGHGLRVHGVIRKPFTEGDLRALLQAGSRTPPSRSAGAGADCPPLAAGHVEAALERGEITVAYQPKLACDTAALVGFEALARWRHAEWGEISPSLFVPLAEETDLVARLTDQVLGQALDWLGEGFPTGRLRLSVNLSARLLDDYDLAPRLWDSCRHRDLDPARVVLEVTETSAMRDPQTTLDLLTRLRIKGFQVSIDDFGVGYSSLVKLARLPFSELKIDTSFVRDLGGSEEARKIVEGVIVLGHSLGMKVTAEGVEEARALSCLQEARCDFAQGYFLGRPMPPAMALRWAHTRLADRFPTLDPASQQPFEAVP